MTSKARPFPDGAIVSSQFAGQGVIFGTVPAHDMQAAGGRPLMHLGGDASSGMHALNISTNDAEFPVPSLEGKFATTRHLGSRINKCGLPPRRTTENAGFRAAATHSY